MIIILAILQDEIVLIGNDKINLNIKVGYKAPKLTKEIFVTYDFEVIHPYGYELKMVDYLQVKFPGDSELNLQGISRESVSLALMSLENSLEDRLDSKVIVEVMQRFRNLLKQYFAFAKTKSIDQQINNHEKTGFIWRN